MTNETNETQPETVRGPIDDGYWITKYLESGPVTKLTVSDVDNVGRVRKFVIKFAGTMGDLGDSFLDVREVQIVPVVEDAEL